MNWLKAICEIKTSNRLQLHKYIGKKEWILCNYSSGQYTAKALVIADSIRTKSKARLLETEWITVSLVYRMRVIKGNIDKRDVRRYASTISQKDNNIKKQM